MQKGFTLIELLVVVLIIGILAAIALPQYTRAVDKTRSVQAISILNTMYKAMQVYYMSNNSYPSSLQELDISLPAYQRQTTSDTEENYFYSWGYCGLDRRGGGNMACNIKYSFGYLIIRLVPTQQKLVCTIHALSSGDEEVRKGFCQGLGFEEKAGEYILAL